jgi:hypothetical protein
MSFRTEEEVRRRRLPRRPRPVWGKGVASPISVPGRAVDALGRHSSDISTALSEPSPSGRNAEYIRWVQHSLNGILNLRLPLDGTMGPETRNALRIFQRKEGLVVSGIVGPDTERRLMARAATTHTSLSSASEMPDLRHNGTYFPNELPAWDGELGHKLFYFKDSARLRTVSLAPAKLVKIDPSWPSIRKALAHVYNRLGGLMGALGHETGIDVQSALAVWYIESGGRRHIQNQAIIRFENHLLYRCWGTKNRTSYDAHFRHGGHNGQTGKSWENHRFRESVEAEFENVHTTQAQEYRVLNLAKRLAGEELAVRCISIGGPQILVSNYHLLGYETAKAMYDTFQRNERYHVLGFFDFCRYRKGPGKGDLLAYLRDHIWDRFAYYYNGPGQVTKYGGRIQNAYDHAVSILV